MTESLYLDHASTTFLRPCALEAMEPWLKSGHGNPSSLHQLGRKSRQTLEDARDQIAGLINCRSREIIFTSGGTEANHLAVLGHLKTLQNLKTPAKLLVSPLEHPSVIELCELLEKEGAEIKWLKPIKGEITPESFSGFESEVHLIACMLANNEIGHITDLAKLTALAKNKFPLAHVHSDAVQALGHMEVDFKKLGVHSLSFSSHKFGGPSGVGALVVNSSARLAPLQKGGSQELGLRAGTENFLGIVGMAAALKEAINTLKSREKTWLQLRQATEERLKKIPGVVFNSTALSRLPHLVNVSFKNIEGEALLIRLDMENIAMSAGSACHADQPDPSHVLKSLGLSPALAKATLRFSFGPETQITDIHRACEVLERLLKDMRQKA